MKRIALARLRNLLKTVSNLPDQLREALCGFGVMPVYVPTQSVHACPQALPVFFFDLDSIEGRRQLQCGGCFADSRKKNWNTGKEDAQQVTSEHHSGQIVEMQRMKRRIMAGLACAVLAGAVPLKSLAVTNTVGATGADYTTIQGAINALSGVNPVTDGDPNNYHTIIIKAGTYSTNSGEAFQTHTVFEGGSSGGRGTAVNASRSLITVDDVDGDMGHSTNRNLDGLHLIGAGVDQTILDAGTSCGTASRVLFIRNKDVVVQGMTLERGNTTSGYWVISGAGILGITNGAIRLENIKIADCASGGDWNAGPVDFRGVDGASFRNVEIAGCVSMGNSHVLQVLGADESKKAFFERLNMHGNQTDQAAVAFLGRSDVIINSLIVGTTKYGGKGGMGIAVNVGGNSIGPGAYLVNCTIVDNEGAAVRDWNYWGWDNYILNSVISGNECGTTNTATGTASRFYCMHNIVNQGDWTWSTVRVDGYTNNTLDDATNDPIPNDPKFKNQAAGDYRLGPGSPAINKIPIDGTGNNAFLLTGGTAPNQFVYVDVNKNGVYDQQLDVIVKLMGHTPTSLDWVSDKDLRGMQRVSAKALDAGCYEFVVGGTVITIK